MRIALSLLAAALSCHGAIVFGTSASTAGSGVSTQAASLGSLPAIGALVVASCGEDVPNDAIGPTFTVTDNQGGGNIYTPVAKIAGGNSTWIRMFYTFVATSAGTFTVSCNSNNSGRLSTSIASYTGVSNQDQYSTSFVGNSLTTTTMDYAVTVQTTNQLVVLAAYSRDTLAATWTAGAGFTVRSSVACAGGHACNAIEDQTLAGGGAITGTISQTANTSLTLGMMVTFTAQGSPLPTRHFVQGIAASLNPTTSTTVTMQASPFVGDRLIVACAASATASGPTLTASDNQGGGNTYTQVGALAGGNNTWIRTFISQITVSSGTFTVTCTSSIAAISVSTMVSEFAVSTLAGTAAIDTGLVTTATATTGNISPTDPVLLIACGVAATAGNTTLPAITASTGYGLIAVDDRNFSTNTGNPVACEYQFSPTGGTFNAGMTFINNSTVRIVQLIGKSLAGGATGNLLIYHRVIQ